MRTARITDRKRKSRIMTILEKWEWQALFSYGRRKAQAAGIRTEEDVERLIDASRNSPKG